MYGEIELSVPAPANQDRSDQREKLFFRLYMTHQKNIYAFILALARNCNDTDDIMQETMAVMWRKFDQFDPGTSFVGWGIEIARRQVMNFRNRNNHKTVQFSNKILEIIDQSATQRKPKLTNNIEILRNCLKKLPDNDRKLIQLRYDQELKIKSIAEYVGRPVQGLYKAMSRIHCALLHCVQRGVSQQKGVL